MINRRTFNKHALATTGLMLASGWNNFLQAAQTDLETNDDGLHIQPWFMETFLDLRDDLQETSGEGKRFAVLFEQKGCPYCRELHAINFKKKQIAEFVPSKFGVLQLNIWGSRNVTDFDGEELEERHLARKWAVNFTPTIVFIDKAVPEGKTGKEAEVARMPGYFKPFHFLSMFEYVAQEKYKDKNFQNFLQDKFADLKAKGIKPEVW